MKKPSITTTPAHYSGYVASYAKDAGSAPASALSSAPIPQIKTTSNTGRPSLLGGV